MTTPNTPTKKGAASLYVVIFTTLLLGIITLGFVRIMLSESLQTSNADLSQSAYDSALAGIEDAKVALLKYHECLSSNSGSPDCQRAVTAMRDDPDATKNCDIVREVLRGADDEHETVIESGNSTGVDMEQAYTCVLISEDNQNYLGQLNENYHAKMVPIRTTNINDVDFIKISWYSSVNIQKTGTNMPRPTASQKSTNKPDGYNSSDNLGLFSALDSSNPYAPPTLGVQLLQTDETFYYDHLNSNNGDQTDRGTLLLYPSTSVTCSKPNLAGNCIIESTSSTGFSASSDKAINTPTPIKCQAIADDSDADAFACSATLAIPKPYNGGNVLEGSSFLRLFLPYGTPETDFSITLCRDAECATTFPFVGVQARIDATGRANDLFRRIESRVELVDVYFPFPEYSAAVKSLDTNAINKNFWVTSNNYHNTNSAYITPDTENLH